MCATYLCECCTALSRDRCVMCIESLVLCIYNVQPRLFCFSRGRPSAHTKQLPSGPGPAHQSQQGHSSPWCMREPGMAYTPEIFQHRSQHSLELRRSRLLSVMLCHGINRRQADPLCLSKNLSHTTPASPIELREFLPDLDLNPGRRESSAHPPCRHCHCHLLTVV